jgi:hypothetical protein
MPPMRGKKIAVAAWGPPDVWITFDLSLRRGGAGRCGGDV